MIKYSELTSRYLLDMFPEFEKEINAQMDFIEEELPHCIYANVINTFLIGFFKNSNPNDKKIAERIFDFYEDLAVNGDYEAKCLLEVSLLEPLWDFKESYLGAKKLMGNETKVIFESISDYLNTPKRSLNTD